jgi:dihydroxyacetone kinase
LDDLPATLKLLGDTLRRELGGSSGPLYGILFLRCGTVLEAAGSLTLEHWGEALTQSCRAISELGGAKPGDRTMLDALHPFVTALTMDLGKKTLSESIQSAVQAAELGAEATSQMMPVLGRSSYLGDRVLGYPDPGARALAIWLRAACDALFIA